ncbi:uncharacterized protein LOC111261627 [Varroa jacobsoni]|uniref:uncharacterized protein LOC111261627 n=1 Tax=Varroa jacobsoni TaxID=62625 RepID=UPI000BF451FF|nr:uncharacterized protein LOC111261627 [Varroa jacobsoni]
MTGGEHIKYVAAKVGKTAFNNPRILPRVGGASEGRRRLLASVAEATALYAAPVWADMALRTKANRDMSRNKLAVAMELTYHTLQVLSGHGQLQTYMAKIDKTQVDTCVLCASGMGDGVEHTLLYCQALKGVRDKDVRREISTKGGVKEMVDMMTKDRKNWIKVTAFFDDIMKKKGAS